MEVERERESEKESIMENIKQAFIKNRVIDRNYLFNDINTLINNQLYQLYIYNNDDRTNTSYFDTNYKQQNYYEIIFFIYNIIIDIIVKLIGQMYDYKYKQNNTNTPRNRNLRNLNSIELLKDICINFKAHFYLPSMNTFKNLSHQQKEDILTLAKLLYSDFYKDYYKKYSYDQKNLTYSDIQKDVSKLYPKKYKNINSKYFYSKMKKYFPDLDQSRLISEPPSMNAPPSYNNNNDQLPDYPTEDTIPPPNYYDITSHTNRTTTPNSSSRPRTRQLNNRTPNSISNSTSTRTLNRTPTRTLNRTSNNNTNRPLNRTSNNNTNYGFNTTNTNTTNTNTTNSNYGFQGGSLKKKRNLNKKKSKKNKISF